MQKNCPNNKINKLQSNIAQKPLEEYNAKGELIGYSWTYGDEIVLEFNITGYVTDEISNQYQTAEQYLVGKTLKLEIFDSRYRVVYEDEMSARSKAQFIILENESIECLPRNIYTLKLTLVDERQDITTTLFDVNDGRLFVK